MMGKYRCRWVRARLPLFAGDELAGSERRRVERHLIGCSGCRQRRAELAGALDVLHAVASQSPVGPEAPSLRPALARQIRESRRPVAAPDFALVSFGGFRLGLRPALLGLSMGLGVLVAIGLGVGGRPHQADAPPAIHVVTVPPSAPKVSAPAPLPEAPAPGRDLPDRTSEAPVVENTPSRSIDYVLEHGTPMPPAVPRDVREMRPTY
ncbi:MAG: zf-HC2 domain-containing protein [Planctomycetaceae bacterium]